MDVKTVLIDNIGLSTRASNALHRAGVKTVGEMMGHTEKTLSEIRNMGRKSIDEVLQKIDEYRKYNSEGGLPDVEDPEAGAVSDIPDDFGTWCGTGEGRAFIQSWLTDNKVKTASLELLSAKAYNYLLINKLTELGQIIFLSAEELMEIPRMDSSSAEEIARSCGLYLKDHEGIILEDLKRKQKEVFCTKEKSLRELLYSLNNHERVLLYVKANDCDVEKIGFNIRAKNLLMKNGLFKISDFIFVTEKEMRSFKGMGAGSLEEIQSFIDDYLIKNEARLRAFCNGDDGVICDAEAVKTIVLDTYNKIGFDGLSLRELREKSDMPKQVPDKLIKSVLGSLLADGTLEYVDFRCYRIYPKFSDYLAMCSQNGQRNREIIGYRLQGETLESIASNYNMTRERVRQIVQKSIQKIKDQFRADTGMEWFDEDYYQYFYETYAFDKNDAGPWLGISKATLGYLELTCAERGTRDLQEAVDDYHHLDYGFRLKIKNYLNRNKLFLDGKWVEKKRANLEEYIVRKYCRDTVSYEEFINIYNNFLKEEEIPYDESIYYTEDVKRTRENKLSADRFLLWTQNRKIRYYDIDACDFSELLDTLNLNAYENIEYSTAKFMSDYPEVMEKYDIRDHYELHNLLRKIVPKGSYHNFRCGKTPMVVFGKFDRNSALLDLLIDSAPISQADFVELVHQEYGYDPATVQGTYLNVLNAYYHQGMYTIDQKVMSYGHMEALEKVLNDDFYYIDEIRRKYAVVVPDADPEEINPYNLKMMGFSVLSRYVYRNYSTLEAYFRDILTSEDVMDITPLRGRFAYVQAFSGTLLNMKKEMEILEFEPNQIICFRKLEKAGISKDDLHAFCDEVDDFTEDGKYFSVHSIKKEGFESELFDLDFSDWFYSSLLAADERFAYSTMFGNIILFKGDERITIKTFEETLIKDHRVIDVYDLMTEMEETYGCRITDRSDLIYKVEGTDVYYDKYMDRLYANTGVYNRELDETEGL